MQILTDTDSSNIRREIILTDGHCLSSYIHKHCVVYRQIDGLNFNGLAGKCQTSQNPPTTNFHYTVYCIYVIHRNYISASCLW